MNTLNHPNLQTTIDNAATLAELLRERTVAGSIDRNLADQLIDMLLTITIQADDLIPMNERPVTDRAYRAGGAQTH